MTYDPSDLSQVWKTIDGENWPDGEKVDYLNQLSEELLFSRHAAAESHQIDARIGDLLVNLTKDSDHPDPRGDEWVAEMWRELYSRQRHRESPVPSIQSEGDRDISQSEEQIYQVDVFETDTTAGAEGSDLSSRSPSPKSDTASEGLIQKHLQIDKTNGHEGITANMPLDENALHRHDSASGATMARDLNQWSIDGACSPIPEARRPPSAARDVSSSSFLAAYEQQHRKNLIEIPDCLLEDVPSPAPPFQGLALQSGNTPGGKADEWFSQLSSTHDLIAGEGGKFVSAHSKRKIAILDSGLAYNGVKEIRNLAAFRSRVIDGVSFIGEDKPWNEDDFGHGTAVTSVVAKTAPNADIYIARVLRYNPKENKCVVDKDAVAQAIVHAVNVWKVDVINMSFGWNADDHDEFDRAMGLAAGRYVDGKLRPVLMFAATSNYGLGPQNHILWPARSPHVISIDAAYGNGAEWEDNPKVNDMGGKLRFTALGVEVNCEYPLHRQPAGTPSGTMVRHTGTSFACATASGIAVFVLEFAQQPPCSWIPELYDRLVRRPDIMQKVFLVMSDSKNVEGFHFLYPWTLLRGYGDDRFGGDATPGTARWDAAYEIAKIMDKEFGSNLKTLFFPEYEKRRPKPA